VITERREAPAKAIYSIKDDLAGMIGMSQRPSLGVRTQSTLHDHHLLSQKSSVPLALGNIRIISIDEARDI
jgi:hypothetical protein